MGKKDNKSIGRVGEETAARFLEKKGYKILDKNWGNKWGEIDIIAKLKVKSEKFEEILVFVEVKTKRGEEFGSPEEMVGRKKLEQIRRMAEIYMVNHEAEQARFMARVDVVAVVLDYDNTVKRINHYEGVYL